MVHSLLGVRQETRILQDDREGGWREKVAILRQLAQGDVTDPEMQGHWLAAMEEGRAQDRKPEQEIRAWFNYLRRHVRYTPASIGYSGTDRNGEPIFRTQILIRPAVLFRRGFGDCTNFSTAGASGLAIAGYDSDFVLVSLRPDGIPSHIFIRVWYPARSHSRLVAFDAIAPHPVGWEPPEKRISWSRIIPVFRSWPDGPSVTITQLSGFGC